MIRRRVILQAIAAWPLAAPPVALAADAIFSLAAPQPKMFAFVYGEQTKVIRRIIELHDEPNSWLTEVAARNLQPGEVIHILAEQDFPIRNKWALQPMIGEPAHSGRCMVVSDGVVVDMCMADPILDRHAKGDLIVSDEANIGWFYQDGRFYPPEHLG